MDKRINPGLPPAHRPRPKQPPAEQGKLFHDLRKAWQYGDVYAYDEDDPGYSMFDDGIRWVSYCKPMHPWYSVGLDRESVYVHDGTIRLILSQRSENPVYSKCWVGGDVELLASLKEEFAERPLPIRDHHNLCGTEDCCNIMHWG